MSCLYTGDCVKVLESIDENSIDLTLFSPPYDEISVQKSSHHKIKKEQINIIENFTGPVYCVTVPNHTLYIRREGQTNWCGNSGTTCVIANKLKRKYIGIDINQEYIDITNKRLEIEK
jgi:DNA modification methylase